MQNNQTLVVVTLTTLRRTVRTLLKVYVLQKILFTYPTTLFTNFFGVVLTQKNFVQFTQPNFFSYKDQKCRQKCMEISPKLRVCRQQLLGNQKIFQTNLILSILSKNLLKITGLGKTLINWKHNQIAISNNFSTQLLLRCAVTTVKFTCFLSKLLFQIQPNKIKLFF
eukprot:TRINITY_DN17760_c0_g2_i1.p2 TRINITY_DN17760_c0_g2~~TRINITY_DN17760_c0_g2_i1.p2  ORF type:complete len:167 (+),score=1.60 TRINITY_DN17760_c0_g2_i1:749-1249(+)